MALYFFLLIIDSHTRCTHHFYNNIKILNYFIFLVYSFKFLQLLKNDIIEL